MRSNHTIKESNVLDDRLADLVEMAQNYKANGYSDAQAMEARGFSFPEEELEEATMRRGTKVKESSEKITRSSFDTPESNAIEEKYLPANGDGDTMASQAVTATTKLIYKWFNDGDVYDNSYGLSGWFNDISGSANWLAKHVPGARDILWRIRETHSKEEYVSNILWPLFNLVYDAKLLSSLEKKPKVDDAYSCRGPFEFNYEDEDAYQEEDPESFGDYDEVDFDESKKTSIGKLLREAAKPFGRDRLGDWYSRSFKERNNVAGKPKMKESKKPARSNALLEDDRNYKRTAYSVDKAFPGIDPAAAEIITGWYCAEGAIEDFDTTDDFAEFIQDDVLDMLDAGSDSADVATVKASLASIGFGSFEEDEVDFEESKKTAATSILREAVVDKDWSEFQHQMFNAISRVYRKFNMGKSSGEATADKMDLIKVLDWMNAHGFWDDEAHIG